MGYIKQVKFKLKVFQTCEYCYIFDEFFFIYLTIIFIYKIFPIFLVNLYEKKVN